MHSAWSENIWNIQLNLYQTRLRSWQRQLPATFYSRWNPASTSNDKPPDGLTTSKGYTLKRECWVTSKTFLGCACIFSRDNNGILERHRLSRVIKLKMILLYFLILECFYFMRYFLWRISSLKLDIDLPYVKIYWIRYEIIRIGANYFGVFMSIISKFGNL